MKNTSWALVTGASSGIGYEFAKLLARHNYNLVLVARSADKLDKLQKELVVHYNVEIKIMAKDLNAPGAAAEIFHALAGTPIDMLINNAGFGDYGSFVETKLERDLEMIQVNITALTALTKLFSQEMVKRKNGKILNVASTAAFLPGPLMAVYYATKAYLLSFSEALANELDGTGVTVTALCPGPTATGFEKAANLNGSNLFKGKLPTAQAVANYGYRSLMQGRRVAIHGLKNKIMVFALRLIPRRLATAIARKVQS